MKLLKFSAMAVLSMSLLAPANAAMAAGETDTGSGSVAQDATQTPEQSASSLASIVGEATSPELKAEEEPAVKTATGSFVKSGDVAVTIPSEASGEVSATTETADGPITVKVGTGSTDPTQGLLADNGSVTYDAVGGKSDHTVQATTDGFRIHTVISDASAPTEITHEVQLPSGARLVAEGDMPESVNTVDGATPSGAIFIVGADGSIIGGFSSPWATDANGEKVPTHYEIRSGNLVQIVDHRTEGVAYPVVADPYLGFDMIKSAKWTFHAGSGWTLEVTPTGWARFNAGGYIPGAYGWDELYSKYKNKGLNTNLSGMRNQFICHEQVVALRAPNKPTWNLDEWRRDVGYLQTVNASCNPGGQKWFD